MPQIGWFEILIIIAIAIIVIGPKDFPFVLKKIGSWIGSIKKYVSNIQQEVTELGDNNFELKALKKAWRLMLRKILRQKIFPKTIKIPTIKNNSNATNWLV